LKFPSSVSDFALIVIITSVASLSALTSDSEDVEVKWYYTYGAWRDSGVHRQMFTVF
jgi:hypothetical protein